MHLQSDHTRGALLRVWRACGRRGASLHECGLFSIKPHKHTHRNAKKKQLKEFMIKTPCDSEDVRIAKNTRRGGASTSDCTQSCPGGPLRCDDTNDPIQGRHAAGRQVCVSAHTTPHHKQQLAVDRRDSLQLRHQLPSHSVFPTPAAVSDTRWRPSVR